MTSKLKPIVSMESTFEKLDIRLGRVISVDLETSAPKKSYKLRIDFGKFGIKTSIGRFTGHSTEEIKGKLLLGVLNFQPRTIGNAVSEVLTLGVQFPQAKSGEATFVTPANDMAKIGSKLF